MWSVSDTGMVDTQRPVTRDERGEGINSRCVGDCSGAVGSGGRCIASGFGKASGQDMCLALWPILRPRPRCPGVNLEQR